MPCSRDATDSGQRCLGTVAHHSAPGASEVAPPTVDHTPRCRGRDASQAVPEARSSAGGRAEAPSSTAATRAGWKGLSGLNVKDSTPNAASPFAGATEEVEDAAAAVVAAAGARDAGGQQAFAHVLEEKAEAAPLKPRCPRSRHFLVGCWTSISRHKRSPRPRISDRGTWQSLASTTPASGFSSRTSSWRVSTSRVARRSVPLMTTRSANSNCFTIRCNSFSPPS
mmetsp:Transcript_165217/g.530279  ORF Transcript_165217/g.530279 Transcript_165217/m.530279 type:complete len:225 (+) Transcript_165217:777-1451(+)